MLKNKDTEIATKDGQLKTKDTEIATKDGQLKTKDTEIVVLKEKLEKLPTCTEPSLNQPNEEESA